MRAGNDLFATGQTDDGEGFGEEESGIAVVLISHNLPEVMELADRIEVLRLGVRVARYRTADQLGRVLQIVQRELHEPAEETPQAPRSAPVRPKTSRRQAASPRPDSGPVPSRARAAQRTTGSLPPASHRQSDPWALQTDTEVYPSEPVAEIDWLAVFLGLVAVAAWGGLIPFFIWVYNNLF